MNIYNFNNNNHLPSSVNSTSLNIGSGGFPASSRNDSYSYLNTSGLYSSEFSPSVTATNVINQRIVEGGRPSSFVNNYLFGNDNDNSEQEDEDDILLPFRNAVVYSRSEDHQRHSKHIFEFLITLLCLIPTTIFMTTCTSIYFQINSISGGNSVKLEKNLDNFLHPHLLSVNALITTIEFIKFLVVFIVSAAFAFGVKVYTLDSQLTGGIKKNHKFFQCFQENLTGNPICCLVGLTCCVLTGYIISNILLSYLNISIFISSITPEFSHATNLKISFLINFVDWILFIMYFLLFYKLQQRQQKLTLELHEGTDDEYYESDHDNNGFTPRSDTTV
ncbi:hypothetical protein C9374_012529 [Naegleria lovaniensis]|uniref:Uncharacterized protein n=1 Tax=Naegleria lovaniensis TaxID=51637 RepID=A0AA88H300_NAELO|nr:uncharacterized protein C9374_012529 [Naegleria lovaniensis]KAG2392277.1 hypothetical protein C9374_012529 [Naegleria lovaniensis]